MTDGREVAESERAPISVSELNAWAARTIEHEMPALWVTGEVSNWMRAASGHCYFVLKDADAQVRCTLFRHRLQYVDRLPANGDHIEVRAAPSLYQARGEFQLNVEFLRLGGVGRLFEAFERLKQKLKDEGLFDLARKRALPSYPRCIGIITSATGAALRDVLTTLRRRMPAINVVIYPTLVQGAEAAGQIAQAIERASRRHECDVLLLCRGGGGIEDLWSFNEEVVARAIAACAIPVVTGVGHETDFTIADFAADVRAPTPTAAAEMASPDGPGLLAHLRSLRNRMARGIERRMEERYQRVDALARRLVHPGARIEAQSKTIAELRRRLERATRNSLERSDAQLRELLSAWRAAAPDLAQRRYQLRHAADALQRLYGHAHQARVARLARLGGALDALAPVAVMRRGFSIVRDGAGAILNSSGSLTPDTLISVQFFRGAIGARVVSVETPLGQDAEQAKDRLSE